MNQLTVREPPTINLAFRPQPMTIDETVQIGKILAQSGFFGDAKQAAQAVAKILAGQELGFGPMAAMTGIYIVRGRVILSANLLAAAIKRGGKYDYRLRPGHPTDEVCSVDFLQGGEKIGTSTFSLDDARKAGLSGDNWKKYPRNMLFARALSNGAKWYCPDILGGPLYTPDEFGLPVDEEGEIVEGQATVGQPIRQDARQWLEEKAEEQGPGPDDAPTPPPPNGNGNQTLADQLGRLLTAVNERTDGHYNHPAHMLEALKQDDPTVTGWRQFADETGLISKPTANDLIRRLVEHVANSEAEEDQR